MQWECLPHKFKVKKIKFKFKFNLFHIDNGIDIQKKMEANLVNCEVKMFTTVTVDPLLG